MFIIGMFWNIWEQRKGLHYLQRVSKICQDLKKKTQQTNKEKPSQEKKKTNKLFQFPDHSKM